MTGLIFILVFKYNNENLFKLPCEHKPGITGIAVEARIWFYKSIYDYNNESG